MGTLIQYIGKNPVMSTIIGFQLFRLLLLPFMGLMPQDAYYHLYGENLSWSYFDHPGMIGYLLKLFTTVFGKYVLVIKLADFTITSLTLYVFYKLAQCFLPRNKVNIAMLLIISTFFISILCFNSTPDVPLLLFLGLSLFLLCQAVFEDKKLYWLYAGLAMGLAFNSKYTALLLPIGLFGFLVFSKKYRKLLSSPWFWGCIILSVAVTFPTWWWNYQHDLASFKFQSANRTDSITEFKLRPKFFFATLGHQTLLLLPILFFTLVALTFKYVRRIVGRAKLPSDKTLFLLAFFIPTFLGFLVLSPIYMVKLNWLMPSYLTGIILAGMFVRKKRVYQQLGISMIVHVLAAVQLVFYAVPVKSNDTWVGWEELAMAMESLQEKHPNTFIFSNDGYKTSAALNFFMDEKVYAQNVIGLPALHFDYLGDDLTTLNGGAAFFVDSDTRFKNEAKRGKIQEEVMAYFEAWQELDPIIIKVNGRKVRKFWVYYCEGYQFK